MLNAKFKMKQFNAQWIWYGSPTMNLVNSWVEARRAFTLKSIPKQAVVRVTADSQYRLYVNGMHVNRGPARGFQVSWPYDTLELAPYLKKGKNVIAVLVHNYGIGIFQYIHWGYGGLLLSGTIGKTGIIPKELDGAHLTENACRLVFRQGERPFRRPVAEDLHRPGRLP
ncbi:MAG: hypothetical protein ACE14V_06350, partial [bacterium]